MAHSQVPALQAEAVPEALDNWCLVLACAGTCSVPLGWDGAAGLAALQRISLVLGAVF